jgi:hypothetical protein
MIGNLQVKDILGRDFYTARIDVKPGFNEILVDIESLVSGVYFIGFQSKYGNVFAKFVKE